MIRRLRRYRKQEQAAVTTNIDSTFFQSAYSVKSADYDPIGNLISTINPPSAALEAWMLP